MTSIIVVFPKPEDAKNIRNLLVRHGFEVAAVCTAGSQAIQYAESGIVEDIKANVEHMAVPARIEKNTEKE